MAVMIPGDGARKHDERSREGAIYSALKRLPDDYYVVHSYDLVRIEDQILRESEFDFVVFCKTLGVLCIEAKAGAVRYSDGAWRYGTGQRMRGNGPFEQASNAKHKLMQYSADQGIDCVGRLKFLHAVWFPSVKRSALGAVNMPPDANREIVLCQDDLEDPTMAINRILSLDVCEGRITTDITDDEFHQVLEKVLCPQFSIIPSGHLEYDVRRMRFVQLLESQQRVLDFLIDQRSVVVEGPAGSGKTLIGIERARRAASCGDKVLFLCFNRLLGEDVKRRVSNTSLIDAYTLAAFCKKLCGEIDYSGLVDRLIDNPDVYFPYRHVVIDEGQDFAIEEIEKSGILEILSELIEDRGGTLYYFYDRNQLIQGSELPGFVKEADSKISLYTNCRNTKAISECCVNGLPDCKRRDLYDDSVNGKTPRIFISSNNAEQIRYIDTVIDTYRDKGIEDIVILSCRSERSSDFAACIVKHERDPWSRWKDSHIRVSTCRKFKGLEAEAVVLVDVDSSIWSYDAGADRYAPRPGLLFYTGASRATQELSIVCNMDEQECIKVARALGSTVTRNPKKALAKKLGALPMSFC